MDRLGLERHPTGSRPARRAPGIRHAPGPHRRRPHTPRATHVLPSVGGRGRRNLTRRHRHGSVLRPDGVAPDPRAGVQTSVLPGPHGGTWTTSDSGRDPPYFRVNVPARAFSAGDGHAIQGDGEFCVTALETSLEGRFRRAASEPTTPTRTRGTTSSRGARGTEPIARGDFHALSHDGVSRGPGRSGGAGAFGYADVDGREDPIGRRGALSNRVARGGHAASRRWSTEGRASTP